MFLLDAVYHSFIVVYTFFFSKNKGEVYERFKTKLSWLPFILALLLVFCSF